MAPRTKRFRLLRAPLLSGIAVSVVAALLIWLAPWSAITQQRERTLDAVTQMRPVGVAPEIVVIDIDERSESTIPWSRARTAELVAALQAAGAAAIAFDLVFSASCEAGSADNDALIAAMTGAPVVLSFFLSDEQTAPPAPRAPLAVRQPVEAPNLWFANGAEHSCDFFEAVATSAGVSSLAGDLDARIRLAPAVVVIADAPYPGLAIEAVRIGKGWQIPIFGGIPPWLRLGTTTIPLDSGANVRFRATGQEIWTQRTVSAGDVLDGAVPTDRLTDAVVFVGSSQPRFGGLRPTASSPLEPSVQIHADVALGILTGVIPFRDDRAPTLEALVALLAGAIAAFVAAQLRPASALAVTVAMTVAWVAFSLVAYFTVSQLIDPLYPAAGIVAAYAVTSILQYSATKRAEENLRRRFGQHLPASIVTRFVENPDLLKLEGEERVITALFTDIEGFTTITQAAGPRELIAMLDTYFEGVTRLVTASGGTVDKFVGDAVHAFFNAPLDLPSHTDSAIVCAIEIAHFTETFRRRPENARFNFGRTRIGIETGPVVVGDVGAGEKIDYTAHGNAMNIAARLEAANKDLGTTVCIGPWAKSRSTVALTSLGEIDVRGFGRLEVFTPASLARSEAGAAQSPTLA